MNIVNMCIIGSIARDIRNSLIRSVTDTPERRAIFKEKIGYDSIDAFMQASSEEIRKKMNY